MTLGSQGDLAYEAFLRGAVRPATNKNLTISGNTATDAGGGLYLVGTAYLLNATIADNSAPAGRGNDLDSEDGGLLIANSIVADTTPGGECAGSATFSNGHNLDAGTSCPFHNTGDISNGNADLGPLQHNPPGPSYVLTRALGPQSQAIDAADDALAPARDARGVERPLLAWPVVLEYSASLPAAVLKAPVVLENSALSPAAVL